MTMHRPTIALVLVLALTATGCRRSEEPAPADKAHAPAAPTNRVDIPAPVRRNLGITFAKVEPRNVARTLRVPGRFEYAPSARREYRLPMPGRIDLLVQQYQRVNAGDILYRLDSAQWRDLQNQIAAAVATLEQSESRLESMPTIRAAHRRHEAGLEAKVALWSDRLKRLQNLAATGSVTGKDLTEAQDVLNATEAELADNMEKDAELESRERELRSEVRSARARLDLLLGTAASVTGLSTAELTHSPTSVDDTVNRPRWRTMNAVEVRAHSAGAVESLGVTNGALAAENDVAVTTIQPEQVRFRARALQADLGNLREGIAAHIVPPAGGTVALSDALPGALAIGLSADPDERTIDLVVTPSAVTPWARAGMAGHLEITLEGGTEELAVPLAAIVRDGARAILFRRDPANPEKVIRMDADVGVSDGRWIVIASGVREGDEVVVGGNYQLMLATSGAAAKGGHFHSDGTFHEGEH